MNKSVLIGAVVLVLLLGGGFFYVKSQKQPTSDVTTETTQPEPSTTTVMPSETPATTGATAQGNVKEFTVTANGINYDVKEMKVKMGDTVRVTFVNKMGMHNWQLDEFGITMTPIKAGESKTVEFVANKKGTFEYYCSVMQHRQMGQKGNLIVE